MKITIDVDCTPEEARAFLGLPDVGPMQATLMAEVEKRMMEGLRASDPEMLMRTWLPAGLQGWEALQKFWTQVGAAGRAGAAGKAKSKDRPGES